MRVVSLKTRWLIAGLFAFAWGVASCGHRQNDKAPAAPREVEVMTLTPSPVRETAEYLGSLLSRQSVSVLPQVGGYVRKILVRPGQKVEPGTVLLEIDSRQESAALESAAAQNRSSTANWELARQTLERTRALFQEGLVSAQELERAQAAAEAAEEATKSSRAQVSQRQVQLQYYAVRAPFAGTVGDVLVRLGDFVTPSTALTSIAQADVLEITVAVPAERARRIQVGTPIELLDSQGQVLLTTSAYFVAPQADARTQLVEVKAVFRNTLGLRPSEWIRARVVFGTEPGLRVPALAVVRQSGQAFIYAVENQDGKTVIARRPVTLGPLVDNSYVVLSGAKEGEQLAVSSMMNLRDGMLIRPKAAKP